MRKVYLEVKVKVIININDDLEISKVMENIEYFFNNGEGFDVLDTKILDYEITDSK